MKALMTIAAFVSLVARLFGASPAESKYKTKEIYDSLLSQVFALQAEQVGAKSDAPILAVLMETGYPDAVVTLVSVIDGSASLYFSNGGGIIGAGENDRPKNASLKLIKSAASYAKFLAKTDKTTLPREAHTRLYFVTPSGLLTAEVKEADLGENRHSLSPLFQIAHELIGEMRRAEEQRGKE